MRFSARETLTLALAALPLTSASLEKRASKYDDYKVYQIDAVGVNYTEIARAAAIAARQTPSLPAMSWFESYRRFEDHLAWLDDVRAAFPKNSQTFVAGKSVEGRQIKGIHLYGVQGPGKRPAVVWHATVHAREWIAAPV